MFNLTLQNPSWDQRSCTSLMVEIIMHDNHKNDSDTNAKSSLRTSTNVHKAVCLFLRM